jgi:predicted transcriptional regulator
VLKALAEKGYLDYRQEGRAYVYRPARPPEDVQHSLLRALMEKAFGGSPTALVQTLVQRESLSDAERAEIQALIDALDDSSPGDPDDEQDPPA